MGKTKLRSMCIPSNLVGNLVEINMSIDISGTSVAEHCTDWYRASEAMVSRLFMLCVLAERLFSCNYS